MEDISRNFAVFNPGDVVECVSYEVSQEAIRKAERFPGLIEVRPLLTVGKQYKVLRCEHYTHVMSDQGKPSAFSHARFRRIARRH